MVVYPNKARTTITLASVKPPISILNPVGNRTSYAYTFGGVTTNSLGYLSRVEDARGHMTTISYQPVGSGTTAIFPTAIQSPVAQYQYKYNSNNQLAAVVDELGNRSSLVWDSSATGLRSSTPITNGPAMSTIRWRGSWPCKTRWACGRPSSTTARAGWLRTSIRWAFEPAMRMTPTASCCTCKDPLGNITTTLHDSVNRLTARIDPLGNRTSFTYDVDSRLIRTTNPIGAITTQIFDANSRLMATVDALGLRTSYAYDISSNLIRTINPLGQINTTVFDLANRPVAQIDALGNRTSFAYDASWNLIRTTNPLGFITTSVFDSVNRLVGHRRSPVEPHNFQL